MKHTWTCVVMTPEYEELQSPSFTTRAGAKKWLKNLIANWTAGLVVPFWGAAGEGQTQTCHLPNNGHLPNGMIAIVYKTPAYLTYQEWLENGGELPETLIRISEE